MNPNDIDFKRIKPVLEDDVPAPLDESVFGSDSAPPNPLRMDAAPEWVEHTLASLSLEEKIGQLMMTSQLPDLEREIREFHLGGVVFLGNRRMAKELATTIDACQARSRIPMIFGIDSEAGLGSRVADATAFPPAMALGAADDTELTRAVGRAMAVESRAVGLNMTASPGLDMNTESRNPVIGTRSFGGNPDLVSRHGVAAARGTAEGGALRTLKHFPGHGAAAGDSHNCLPSIDIPASELETLHGEPFRRAIEETDPEFVMSCHIWFPAIHPDGPWPATLSRELNIDLLRDKFAFQGTLVSDSFEMEGAALAIPDEGERAVVGIENGLDVILQANSCEGVFKGLLAAVKSGRLTVERIDDSVRRVLSAKARAGLDRRPDPVGEGWESVLRRPEHRALARTVSERAVTRVKGGPIIAGEKFLLLDLQASLKQFFRLTSDPFIEKLKQLGADFEHVRVPAKTETFDAAGVLDSAYKTVLVCGRDTWHIDSLAQVDLIRRLCAEGGRVVYTSFGTPYHLHQIPEVDSFYCGYTTIVPMQEVMAEVVLGRREAPGSLPVDV